MKLLLIVRDGLEVAVEDKQLNKLSTESTLRAPVGRGRARGSATGV